MLILLYFHLSTEKKFCMQINMEIYIQIFNIYKYSLYNNTISLSKCMYVFLMVTLRIHMSCLEGEKGLHHCLIRTDTEEFVNGNTSTEART